MSDDLHPDLDEFYDTIGGDEDQWVDEDEDQAVGSYQVYVDPDDIFDDEDDGEEDNDEDYIFEDDIGEIYDDDDEDEDEDMEEGESDEDLGNATLLNNEDDGSAEAFRELQNLINLSNRNTNSGVGEEEDLDASTILQRLLSGGIRITNPTNSQNILSRIGLINNNNEQERRERRRRERNKEPWFKTQLKPDKNGLELLNSGEFGKVGEWSDQRLMNKNGIRRPKAKEKWMNGWSGPKITSSHRHAMVPNTPGTIVASYPSVPYVGQFAKEDYSLFYTATQFFTIHLYSMNQSRKNHINPNPNLKRRRSRSRSLSVLPQPQVQDEDEEEEEEEEDEDDYETEDSEEDDEIAHMWNGFSGRRQTISEDSSLKRIKRVQGVEGQWTVTDCDADKKGEKMIYSSITPYVHMLYTAESDQEHIELNFSEGRGSTRWGYDRFGIWSIRFSADGKEIVAGAGSGQIMVYDIEAQRRTLAVRGHHDDVNAVSFADESSTNILISGSDDGYVKIWDRRSLSSSTPSGILVGATEGITYTSPKGDGRYIIVNSKDQAARLYDLRKMRSANEFDGEPDAVSKYGSPGYDYRNMDYPRPKRLAHPKDCSIMTFRGHSVLRTLIRCHFSPRESTGQSYIYSGSADGLIHIWSLDGRVVQVLNRAESLPLKQNSQYSDPSSSDLTTNTRSTANYESYGMGYTVRDVAWHGYEPTLMSTCWETNGQYRRGGNIAKHEWKGLGKGGLNRLEDWVEKKKSENEGDNRDTLGGEGRRRMPGSMADWDL